MKKEQALEIINAFPAEFDVEELLEKLVFIQKVEKGMEQLKNKKKLSHGEVKKKTQQW